MSVFCKYFLGKNKTRYPWLTSCLIMVIFLLSLSEAFDGAYLLHVTKGEMRILMNRFSLTEALESPAFRDEEKGKLELIRQVRSFASEKLHLNVGKRYSTISSFQTPIVALSAARKDAFEAYSWYFPIVGEIPYKGFFGKEAAKSEFELLKKRGYDTLLRPVSAFSTIGWFDDPVLLGFLSFPEESICRIILHELTHATVYLPGKTDFNENIATFVELEGALEFYREFNGANSIQRSRILDYIEAKKHFTKMINELYNALNDMYKSDVDLNRKMEMREEIFNRLCEAYKTHEIMKRNQFFRRFLQNLDMNNAEILSYRRYQQDLDLLYRLLQQEKSIVNCIEIFRKIPVSLAEPMDYIEKRLRKVDN